MARVQFSPDTAAEGGKYFGSAVGNPSFSTPAVCGGVMYMQTKSHFAQMLAAGLVPALDDRGDKPRR